VPGTGGVIDDRPRVRQRLKAFLLRHGRIYRDGSSWSRGHVHQARHGLRVPVHQPGSLSLRAASRFAEVGCDRT